MFMVNSTRAKVNGLSLKPKNKDLFKILKLDEKIKQYYCDINDFKKTNDLIKKIKPDIIFHLAAQSLVTTSFENPLNTIQTNVYGSAVILKSFIDNRCKALVYCTSDKCYKNKEWIFGYKETDELGGIDPYSASKASAEIIFNSFMKSYNINKNFTSCGSVRAGNVIGGGDFNDNRLIPDIVKNYYKRSSVKIKNPHSVRPWQFVLDPLFGYLKLGLELFHKKKSYDLASWNFGPDIETKYTVNYLINQIKKNNLPNLKVIKDKNRKYYESKLLFLSNEKAKLELNWKSKLDINESLNFTFDWYQNYYLGKDSYDFSVNQINQFSEMK